MNIWFIAFVIAALAALGLLIAILAIQAEIRSIASQTRFISESDTNLEIMLGLRIPSLVKLSKEINGLVVSHKNFRREANAANKSLRESITNISHDLRTPLTAASGYIKMLKKIGLSEEKRSEYTDVISQRIVSVQRMLDQLFEYARIEADEISYEAEKVNVNNLLRDVLGELYDRFLTKGITPAADIPEKPFNVMAPPDLLTRVLFNIINNAIVHGENSFSVSSELNEGNVVMKFSNGSSSVSPAELGSIFDRFYTTDKSRSRKTTGLGLSIAHNLVIRMNGKISASLDDDNLFTITVVLPMAK